MFGIGMFEWLLIAGIALVVIGPEKFPDFAKVVIKTVRDLRGYVEDMKTEVSKELTPLKKEMDTLSRVDPEKYIDSLTGASDDKEEKKSSKTSSSSSMHEEDRKVMEGAADDSFGEDPYGWHSGDDDDYGVDHATNPEETVGYGQEYPDDCEAESFSESNESVVSEAVGEVDGGEVDGGETEEDTTPSPERSGEPDLLIPEDDRIELTDAVDGGEPDVWTGR